MQVLRTVIASADSKGQSVFLHFNTPRQSEIQDVDKNIDLNKLMQNVGSEQFDYETFVAAYETDPRLKTMIANYNETGITPNTKKQNKMTSQGGTPAATDTVSQMAKRATDLTDLA